MRPSIFARPLLLALCASLALCGAPIASDAIHASPRAAAQPPAEASAAQPRPGRRLFDPSCVQAPPGSSVQATLAAIESGAPADARALAEAALDGSAPLVSGRLRWLAAEAALSSGAEPEALAHLEALMAMDHPLAPWARLRLAAAIEATSPARAAALTEDLRHRWAGRAQARSVHARALAASGETARGIQELRALVAEAPARLGAASAAMPLAELLAASDALAAKEEALGLYRRVQTRAPGARVGQRAATLAAALLATLPAERRAALEEIPEADALARGQAFYDSVQYREAERAFAALAARDDIDGETRCQARLMQGRALERRRQRRPAAALLIEVAEQCTGREPRAWARYKAGRALGAVGEREQAIAQYEALEREAPDHRLADDALYHAALLAEGAGDVEGMLRRLRALPDRYPRGDMRPEALFRLAWHARGEGDHAQALLDFERLIREGAGEQAEDIVGRASYWRARTLLELGRQPEAETAYEELARRWPLSYYAQQALHRLRELGSSRLEAALGSLHTPPTTAPSLRFSWRQEMQEGGFIRAIELLRVRSFEAAERELRHLGALGEGADPDALWLAASLYANAGDPPRAAQLVRRRLRSFRRTAPTGRARGLWRLAYPNAFSPLIEEAAAREHVPAAFVRAIAREESSFNPKAVSWAHAYGLVQLILPTARHWGEQLGLPITATTLGDPETNLRVGSRFMRYLWERYEDNPALVPSAYNAGPGAVDRWLRARPSVPLDAWIEEIPYAETRRYTRRVLQTYGIYAWLESGQLPPLPAQLPSRG